MSTTYIGRPWWPTDETVRIAQSPGQGPVTAARAVADLPGTRQVQPLLQWARELGQEVPVPGEGGTLARWEVLATIASRDLVAARVLEPHLDALAILHEARTSTGDAPGDEGQAWGVWAAEGAGTRLRAARQGDHWVLEGDKPWCSLAGQVGRGLVSAWVDDHSRGLFAVDTSHSGFHVDDSEWSPLGLAEVSTARVTMRQVVAASVGPPGWYLDRPGFAWGGLGVAAVWYGGAVAVARRLVRETHRRDPDDIALLHIGELDARLGAARLALADAAEQVERGEAEGPAGAHLAASTRHLVVTVAEEVLTRTSRALGPAPLAREPDHARRVADLGLYLRQHHGERDAVALARMLLRGRPG